MKIIYCLSPTLDTSTIMQKGILVSDSSTRILSIQSKLSTYQLDHISSVEKWSVNGLGTMVKIVHDNTTIFLAVPRLFLPIGTGLAVLNYTATSKAYDMLFHAMEQQNHHAS